ncbi:MAG TPA: TIGR03546 family protein [Bdellovibrionales bacterium]|nr:TIGR03546 family protein [Bdellovibrionales bacterium]
MTLLLKQLFAFFKLLNSDTGTNQLAAGIACGLILGFSPVLSLQTLLVFVLLFFFRIQIGAAFLAAFFFKFVAFIIDPLAHQIGSAALQAPGLQGLWTQLYNMPIVPYTRFNNSIVMGSGILAIALTPVVFFVSKILIVKYRKTVVERFKQTKLWKLVQATYFYKWYAKYDETFGSY